MREEAPGRHVEGVDPGLLQPLAHLHRFLGRIAGRPDAEERDGVVVFLHADLHLQVEVVADLLADRAHDLEDEAGAVLERSAVLVLPIVDGRAEELRDQVAVGAVQLDAVEPGFARAPRALRVGLDRLPNLLGRHPVALEAVRRIRLVRGAQAARIFDALDVALPAAMTELQDVLAVMRVNRLAEGAPERNVAIVIDHRVVRDDPPAQVHRHERRHDRADPAFRELHFPVDARLIAGAVVVVEASRDVGADDAVLDGQIAERQWLEDRVERHTAPPRRIAR